MARVGKQITNSAPAGACLESRDRACEPGAFLLYVRRERARVDRHGGSFGLALWDLGPRGRDPAWCASLIRTVRATMRSIDLLGWVDPVTLGALLPGSGIEGVRAFVRHAEEALAPRMIPPRCSVFSYPSTVDESVRPLWEESPGATGALPGKDGSAALFLRLFPKPLPAWKRILDVTGSLLGLLALSPLFAVIALLITAVSPGPVLFRQRRVGRAGRTFTFLKFRTMEQGSDDSAHREHLRELIHGAARPMAKLDERRDRRVIRGGGFLRRTSLDELPQLVNVLRGDMSLVGPRPCIPYEAREFLVWHTARFDVRPGMTGLWQVSGKNHLSFAEMIRLDIAYARRITFLRDLLILLKTVPTVIGLAAEALARRLPAAGGAGVGQGSLEDGRLSHV